jgi:hypothetical protein
MGFEGTGVYYKANTSDDKLPEYDPRSGDHLWIVIGTWKVNPKNLKEGGILDRENILGIMGPGCFFCEKPYTTLLDSRRCKGEPQS